MAHFMIENRKLNQNDKSLQKDITIYLEALQRHFLDNPFHDDKLFNPEERLMCKYDKKFK